MKSFILTMALCSAAYAQNSTAPSPAPKQVTCIRNVTVHTMDPAFTVVPDAAVVIGADGRIERIIRINREVSVGVSLHDRQSLCHAAVHAGLFNLESACPCAAVLLEQLHQLSIPAPDVEYKFSRPDMARDREVIGPAGCRGSCGSGHDRGIRGGRPLASAAASTNPVTAASKSGSSSRKASCPLSVSIDT